MSEKIKIQKVVSALQVETSLNGRFKPARLEERMRHYYTPGISITIVNDGKVAWSRGFGYKNIRTEEKVDENTMFLAGSISKPVFTLAVLKLVEAGSIDLDRDANEYLKRWKIPKRGKWQPRVTMRQLLGHTSGLTVQGFPGYRRTDPVPSTVEILKGVLPANTEPVLVNVLPGTIMRYSGGGITVAQLLVEDVIGKPFPEIMEELLFKPLGLKNSTYRQSPLRQHKNRLAQGYPFYCRAIDGGHHIYPEMAAAGLWSNGPDLAVLMLEVQKALRGERSFFGEKSVREMLTPQKAAKSIGMGFFLEGAGPSERFYHNGWDEGFVAKLVSYKHGGKGAVILLNSNSGYPMIDEILRSIALEYDWTDYLPKRAEPVLLPRRNADQYCGTFMTDNGLKFRILSVSDGLRLGFEEQLPVRIFPVSRTEFHSDILNLKVQFEFNKHGKIERMAIVQGGNVIKAERQKA